MTYEDANRRAKALRLVEFLCSTRPDAETALFDAVHADGPTWSLWARRAGVRSPSLDTQAVVVSLLEVAVRPIPSDPFAGLPR